MTTAEKFVTAAYLVFLGVLLLYVVIFSLKVCRLEREVADLSRPALPEAEVEPEKERALVA